MNSNGKIVSKKASKAAKNKNLGAFEKSKNSKGFELSPKKGSKDYKDFKKLSTKRKNLRAKNLIAKNLRRARNQKARRAKNLKEINKHF